MAYLKRSSNRKESAKPKNVKDVSQAASVQYEFIVPYNPLPWQVEPWRDKSPILLLSGSAGSGKSRLAAEKCHAFALRYPGSTVLVLRKVRATMANSTLLFLRREVIGNDPRVIHRAKDFRFDYANGSIMAYGGMRDDEQREHIRSIGQKGGVDLCWMEEGSQFDEEDFNEVLARMRGTAANWRQIMISTNPDSPDHWINNQLIMGGNASCYYASALDNPYLPDEYQDTLRKMRGIQYRRLVLGEWCEGAGRIFDVWVDEINEVTGYDGGGNVTYRAEYIPDGGPIVWAIDDGYAGKMDKKTKLFDKDSHPRAILLCQLRGDGQVAVFYESFEVLMLAADHIQRVLTTSEAKGWPRPSWIVRDRAAASLDGAFKQFNLRGRYTQHLVEEGIKEMREWLAADENGWRRLIVHPRCRYFRREMMSYSYDDHNRVIKAHDDGLDACRYLCWILKYSPSATVDIASIFDIPTAEDELDVAQYELIGVY